MVNDPYFGATRYLPMQFDYRSFYKAISNIHISYTIRMIGGSIPPVCLNIMRYVDAYLKVHKSSSYNWRTVNNALKMISIFGIPKGMKLKNKPIQVLRSKKLNYMKYSKFIGTSTYHRLERLSQIRNQAFYRNEYIGKHHESIARKLISVSHLEQLSSHRLVKAKYDRENPVSILDKDNLNTNLITSSYPVNDFFKSHPSRYLKLSQFRPWREISFPVQFYDPRLKEYIEPHTLFSQSKELASNKGIKINKLLSSNKHPAVLSYYMAKGSPQETFKYSFGKLSPLSDTNKDHMYILEKLAAKALDHPKVVYPSHLRTTGSFKSKSRISMNRTILGMRTRKAAYRKTNKLSRNTKGRSNNIFTKYTDYFYSDFTHKKVPKPIISNSWQSQFNYKVRDIHFPPLMGSPDRKMGHASILEGRYVSNLHRNNIILAEEKPSIPKKSHFVGTLERTITRSLQVPELYGFNGHTLYLRDLMSRKYSKFLEVYNSFLFNHISGPTPTSVLPGRYKDRIKALKMGNPDLITDKSKDFLSFPIRNPQKGFLDGIIYRNKRDVVVPSKVVLGSLKKKMWFSKIISTSSYQSFEKYDWKENAKWMTPYENRNNIKQFVINRKAIMLNPPTNFLNMAFRAKRGNYFKPTDFNLNIKGITLGFPEILDAPSNTSTPWRYANLLKSYKKAQVKSIIYTVSEGRKFRWRGFEKKGVFLERSSYDAKRIRAIRNLRYSNLSLSQRGKGHVGTKSHTPIKLSPSTPYIPSNYVDGGTPHRHANSHLAFNTYLRRSDKGMTLYPTSSKNVLGTQISRKRMGTLYPLRKNNGEVSPVPKFGILAPHKSLYSDAEILPKKISGINWYVKSLVKSKKGLDKSLLGSFLSPRFNLHRNIEIYYGGTIHPNSDSTPRNNNLIKVNISSKRGSYLFSSALKKYRTDPILSGRPYKDSAPYSGRSIEYILDYLEAYISYKTPKKIRSSLIPNYSLVPSEVIKPIAHVPTSPKYVKKVSPFKDSIIYSLSKFVISEDTFQQLSSSFLEENPNFEEECKIKLAHILNNNITFLASFGHTTDKDVFSISLSELSDLALEYDYIYTLLGTHNHVVSSGYLKSIGTQLSFFLSSKGWDILWVSSDKLAASSPNKSVIIFDIFKLAVSSEIRINGTPIVDVPALFTPTDKINLVSNNKVTLKYLKTQYKFMRRLLYPQTDRYLEEFSPKKLIRVFRNSDGDLPKEVRSSPEVVHIEESASIISKALSPLGWLPSLEISYSPDNSFNEVYSGIGSVGNIYSSYYRQDLDGTVTLWWYPILWLHLKRNLNMEKDFWEMKREVMYKWFISSRFLPPATTDSVPSSFEGIRNYWYKTRAEMFYSKLFDDTTNPKIKLILVFSREIRHRKLRHALQGGYTFWTNKTVGPQKIGWRKYMSYRNISSGKRRRRLRVHRGYG